MPPAPRPVAREAFVASFAAVIAAVLRKRFKVLALPARSRELPDVLEFMG